MNKKGLTLVELIITVTILVVLTSVLVPSLIAMQNNAKKKADEAVINELVSTATAGACTSSVYPSLVSLANQTIDKKVTLCYRVHSDGTLQYRGFNVNRSAGSMMSIADINAYLTPLYNYITSNVDKTEIMTTVYNDKYLAITFVPTDLNNVVKVSSEWRDDFTFTEER